MPLCPAVQQRFDALKDQPLARASFVAIEVLERAGFEAYLVGGMVRDALLGRPIHDGDLTTNAPYETLVEVFTTQGYAVYRTGEKHGTATVAIDGFPLEITRFRADGIYQDLRHPQNVTFVKTIQEDLARRDFTINAMAYNPRTGVVDPFDGQLDLAAGIIRCVGDASTRFNEDALRILRALRFGSQLDFALEEGTAQAIHECFQLLEAISAERLYKEFTRLLCGQNPYPLLMEYHDVVFQLIPELADCWEFHQNTPYHIYTVYDHIAHCVQTIENDPLNRWVALLHDAGKPAAYAPDETGRGHFPGHAKMSVRLAEGVAARFKMPRAFTEDLLLLVARHDDVVEETPKAVKRMLHKMDGRPELFVHLCAMKRADTLSQAPRCLPRLEMVDHLLELLSEVLEEKPAFSTRDLAVGGTDLIGRGYAPGPLFSQVLDAALEAVLDERIANTPEDIWEFWESEGLLEM